MFSTKYTPFEDLIYHSIQKEPKFNIFIDDVRREFEEMVKDGGSTIIIPLPTGCPAFTVLRKVKRVLPKRVKLNIKESSNDPDVTVLGIWDPLPSNLYKYGY